MFYLKGRDYKIKTLHIKPGKSLSDQRHFKRNEHWFILEGELSLNGDIYHKNDLLIYQLKSGIYQLILVIVCVLFVKYNMVINV
jgi:hypothetical protein